MRLLALALGVAAMLCGGSEVNATAAADETFECVDPAPIRKKYMQDDAPQDMKAALQQITELVNNRFQEVLKVELKYGGTAIHRQVGRHRVVTSVQLLENGERVTRCVVVEIEIQDVDECTLPASHPMHHRCHASALCVNTNGSYACACPNDEPAVPDAGAGLCGGKHNTTECCDVRCPRGDCLDRCRADFRCFTDPCPGDCVELAVCSATLGRYTCTCKDGLVGNGHRCRGTQPLALVSPEGLPLTEASGVCGCQPPKIDYCYGVDCGGHSTCRRKADSYECVCDKGFKYSELLGGCVDESLPVLQLAGPNPLVLRQCDSYSEPGLDIIDRNSEDYARSLEVDYSQPLGQCLMTMGTFAVDYTIQTNWTEPKNVSVRREVVVLDVDECSLPPEVFTRCPQCKPACVPEATCINTEGSYTCRCPPCTGGDGFEPHLFRAGAVPQGYEGGTGCKDVCPPVLTLMGEATKVFRVCKCTGLLGGDAEDVPPRDFDAEIKQLVRRSKGEELCDPQERPCVRASDQTGTGEVDLTHRVNVGEPYRVGPNRWKVPYAVTDDAGNAAVPVEREIVVLELTLEEFAKGKVVPPPPPPPPPPAVCPACPDCPKTPPSPPSQPAFEAHRSAASRRRQGGEQSALDTAGAAAAVAGGLGATGETEDKGEADAAAAGTCPVCQQCPICPAVTRREAAATSSAAGPAFGPPQPNYDAAAGFPVHLVLLWVIAACFMMLFVFMAIVACQWAGRGPDAAPATPYRGSARRDDEVRRLSIGGTPASLSMSTPGSAAAAALSSRRGWGDDDGYGRRESITPSRPTRASPRPGSAVR